MDQQSIRKLIRGEIYKESDYELLNEFFGKIKGAAQGAVQGFKGGGQTLSQKDISNINAAATEKDNLIKAIDDEVAKMKQRFKNMTGVNYDGLTLEAKRELQKIVTQIPESSDVRLELVKGLNYIKGLSSSPN